MVRIKNTGSKGSKRHTCATRRKLQFEGLEERVVLTTFYVDNVSNGTFSTGEYTGTLRWAVQQANLLSDLNRVQFDLDSSELAQGITLSGSAINITSPIQFLGQGPSSKATIRADFSSGNAFQINSSVGGGVAQGFSFQDIVIQGGFTNGIAVTNLPSNGQLFVNRVDIFQSDFDGIDLTDGGDHSFSATIQNSSISNNGAYGIHARNAGSSTTNLTITQNTLINNNKSGIKYDNFDAAIKITSNRIGITSGGIVGSNDVGVFIDSSSTSVTSNISGNTISGNTRSGSQFIGAGVLIDGSNVPGLSISNNFIGTNVSGQLVVGGGNSVGVDVQNNSVIGPISSNAIASSEAQGINVFNSDSGVISGNNIVAGQGDGIRFSGGADQWVVFGNNIGSDSISALGNGGAGLTIEDSFNNIVENNLFGLNGGSGIRVTGNASDAHGFRQDNDFINNTGVPIDLADDGFTANDGDDADPGPNNLLNFAAIPNESILASGGAWLVKTLLDFDETGVYEVQFYRYTETGVGSGSYEYLGAADADVQALVANGIDAEFSVPLSTAILSAGDRVATVVRGKTGNNASFTSEMSVPSSPMGLLLGDYNRDGSVDGADYSVWRDNLGASVAVDYDGADGDGSMVIDSEDYQVWVSNYGATSTASAAGAAPSVVLWGQAPQVTNVTISGSQSTHTPYSFGSVVGSGEQLRTVPVGGADTISITFSEDV